MSGARDAPIFCELIRDALYFLIILISAFQPISIALSTVVYGEIELFLQSRDELCSDVMDYINVHLAYPS